MANTAKGVPYPVGGDPPDGPTQIKAVADYIDAAPGIAPLTYAAINALAGGDLWDGRRVYQTNTGANRLVKGEYVYNGVNWRLPWNMPWGILVKNTLLTDATSYVTYATVPGLAATITVVANRNLRLTFNAPFHNSTSGQGAAVKFLDGATQIALGECAGDDNTSGELHLEFVDDFSAGSHTFTPQVARDHLGAVDLLVSSTRPAQFIIEDCGPSGIPT